MKPISANQHFSNPSLNLDPPTDRDKSSSAEGNQPPSSTSAVPVHPGSTSSTFKQWKFRALSYNIDTNMARLEKGFALESHPEWRANQRAELIKKTVKNIIELKRPEVVNIQECRRFKDRSGELVDSLTPLKDLFEELGYEKVVSPYNKAGGDEVFQFITAYDPEKLTLLSQDLKFLTKTPDTPTVRPDMSGKSEDEKNKINATIKDNNYGTAWERGVLITEFEHNATKEKIFTINVHLDIPLEYRLRVTVLLTQFIQKIVEENPSAKIVATGDFNAFSDWGGPKQMEKINSATFNGTKLVQEATQKLRFSNKEDANHTFIPFPYDFVGKIEGTNIDGTEIHELISQISPEKDRDEALSEFSKADKEDFKLNRFLSTLNPKCRKTLIGLIFDVCRGWGNGKLDRVLYRGFDENAKSKVLPDMAKVYKEPKISDYNDVQQIKNYMFENYDNGPAFSSDHQPVLTTFKVNSGSVAIGDESESNAVIDEESKSESVDEESKLESGKKTIINTTYGEMKTGPGLKALLEKKGAVKTSDSDTHLRSMINNG